METRQLNPPLESWIPAYGRTEVRAVLQRNFMAGLVAATLMHALVIGAYYLAVYLQEDDDAAPTVAVRIVKYSDLGPPPSIAPVAPPPSVSVTASARPSVGMPVPVPDAEVTGEATIATQTEMSNVPSPVTEDLTGGEGAVQVTQDIAVQEDADPTLDEFIPVEKAPQIISKVMPVYPDMAVRAGLEGTVWVKILVEKDGKPKKAVVIKSTSEIFEQAAIDAAMKFAFTPAYMNNGPVKVWVSFPFRFKLKEASPS
jgi:protein TonB